MNKVKIKTGDKVRVISGSQKGSEGVVIQVIPKLNSVVIEGVNLGKRQKKAPDGSSMGREDVTMPINVSKVAFVGQDGKTSKLGYKLGSDGKKTRISRKTGKEV